MANLKKGQSILYMVRHGQTDWNVEKRLQGHVDIPLNDQGLLEATAVAEELQDQTFDAIYSSPLKRAFDTAQIINEKHQQEIQISSELKEATYGSMEGALVADYHRACKERLVGYQQMSNQERVHFKLVPDAESYFEVYHRVKPVLQQIVEKHAGGQVLVVTHGGLMRSLFAMLTEIDVLKIQIQNGGYLRMQGDGNHFSILDYTRILISA